MILTHYYLFFLKFFPLQDIINELFIFIICIIFKSIINDVIFISDSLHSLSAFLMAWCMYYITNDKPHLNFNSKNKRVKKNPKRLLIFCQSWSSSISHYIIRFTSLCTIFTYLSLL